MSARLASVGLEVVLGSRTQERATEVVDALIKRWSGHDLALVPATNEVAAQADLVVLATPVEGAVNTVRGLVDELSGKARGTSRKLVTFVTDRPGHDARYSVDSTRAETELGWKRACGLEDGLRRTVRWYFDHPSWCSDIASKRYQRERLGLGGES